MPYKYVAYTADKTVVEGTIDATTEGLAREALGRSGYKLLSLKAARPRLSIRRSVPTLFGVKTHHVVAFSRQLATLIERGTTTLSALQLLRDHIRNVAFKEVLSAMIQDLQQGSSLSEAISRHPQAFPPIYSRMVKVSEQTGNLEVALRQIASHIEREKAVLKKVSRAMIYPAFILLVAGGVVTLMTAFTLPPLLEMFTEFEAELPLVTKLLMGVVGFVTAYKFYLPAVMIGVAALAVWYVRKPAGRHRLDRLLIKTPLIGPITTLRDMSHFSRTMSMLLGAGLPMPEIMDMVVQTTRNGVVREAVEDIQGEILKGGGLSRSMTANELFPPLLVQMVKVGEEAGTLSADLMAVADSYEQEVDERVNSLLSILEPGLLVVLGLFVAFIAISVIMPIYSIMGSIG